MGPDLQKFRRGKKYQPFFEGEKSLQIGKGFRPWAAHPVKKSFEYPPAQYYPRGNPHATVCQCEDDKGLT